MAYNYKNTLLRRHFISYASVCYQDEPFMTGITNSKVAITNDYYITCKRLDCVHHRSLPTRKLKNRNIGRIKY